MMNDNNIPNSFRIITPEEERKISQRIEEAKRDPVVFVDRFLYTFNPKVPPYHLEFRPFDFQKNLIYKIKEAIEGGEDLFIEKCREMGATYVTLAVFLWFWLYVPGSNFLLGSRKEDYVDNSKSTGNVGVPINKEESLFGKIDYMLRRLLPIILPQGFNFKRHLTYMSLVNPANGNVISGESANPNFSRGGRFKAILLDEFSFWDSDYAVWGSTADTTNCRIVLTTPGIRPNTKAKRLRFGEDGEKINVVSLPYYLDPRKTEVWLARERERRSEEDFAREIMINWEGSVKGRVYKEISQAVLGDYPYQPTWPLYVSWDFGLDGTAIQWWQINMKNAKPRLVFAFEKSDEPIEWFLPFFNNPVDSEFFYDNDDLKAIDFVKNFKPAVHYGDPDVSKRSYASKNKASAKLILAQNKIYVQTNTMANDFANRREATKVLLQGGVEVNINDYTRAWLEAMKNATYPQRSEASQAISSITLPIHDWTSHHRTATEYFAVNVRINSLFADPEEKPSWTEKLPNWQKDVWSK